MSEPSLAQPARTIPPAVANDLLDRLELELARLERGRPHLAERVQRASNLIVSHLAGRPSRPVVRVRTTPSGRARFLFNSLATSGVVYSVEPGSWSCTCPDRHRRGDACKHSIAAYALWRVSRVADRSHGVAVRRDPAGCPMCTNGLVKRTQPCVNTATGELKERVLTLPCKSCGGAA